MPDLQNARFDRAYDLFSVHHYEAAEKELRTILDESPDDPWALALLALCLSCQNDFAAAHENARAAVTLAPKLAFTHYAMASILEDQDVFDEALISARQAVRLDPDDPLYHAQLAMIYYEQQRWAEALQAAERGLAIRPDDADCRQIREQVLSADDLELDLPGKDPTDQGLILMLAAARNCLAQDQADEALAHYRQALAIDAHSQEAQEGVLDCLSAEHPLRVAAIRFFSQLAALRFWVRATLVCAAFISWPIAHYWLPTDRRLAWALIAVAVAVYLLWMARPVSRAVMLTIPAGRPTLTKSQRTQVKWLYLIVLLSAGWTLLWILGQWPTAALMIVITALLGVPISRVYECEPGWSRLAMALYAVVVGMLAMATIGLVVKQVYPLAQVVMYLVMPAVVLSAALARYLNHADTANHRSAAVHES